MCQEILKNSNRNNKRDWVGSPTQEIEAPRSESTSLVSKSRAVLTTENKFRALLHPICLWLIWKYEPLGVGASCQHSQGEDVSPWSDAHSTVAQMLPLPVLSALGRAARAARDSPASHSPGGLITDGAVFGQNNLFFWFQMQWIFLQRI